MTVQIIRADMGSLGASDFQLDPSSYVKVGGHVSPDLLVANGGQYEYPANTDAWVHSQFSVQNLTGPEVTGWAIGCSVYNITDDTGRCDKGTTKACSLLAGSHCGTHILDPSMDAVNLGKITKPTTIRVKWWANHDMYPSAFPDKSKW